MCVAFRRTTYLWSTVSACGRLILHMISERPVSQRELKRTGIKAGERRPANQFRVYPAQSQLDFGVGMSHHSFPRTRRYRRYRRAMDRRDIVGLSRYHGAPLPSIGHAALGSSPCTESTCPYPLSSRLLRSRHRFGDAWSRRAAKDPPHRAGNLSICEVVRRRCRGPVGLAEGFTNSVARHDRKRPPKRRTTLNVLFQFPMMRMTKASYCTINAS